MADEITIVIGELVEQTVTRARAKEAFCGLINRLSMIAKRPIMLILDFSSEQTVTGSFLDEIVLRTSDLPSDVAIVFRLASNNDVEKLGKVCALRKIHCSYQVGNDNTMHRTKNAKLPRIDAQEYRGAFFTT